MGMKVPLSFKKTEKEMYEYLMKQLSPSIFVKQLLKNEIEKQQPKEIKRDIFNF
jgi:hypothetical protein